MRGVAQSCPRIPVKRRGGGEQPFPRLLERTTHSRLHKARPIATQSPHDFFDFHHYRVVPVSRNGMTDGLGARRFPDLHIRAVGRHPIVLSLHGL